MKRVKNCQPTVYIDGVKEVEAEPIWLQLSGPAWEEGECQKREEEDEEIESQGAYKLGSHYLTYSFLSGRWALAAPR